MCIHAIHAKDKPRACEPGEGNPGATQFIQVQPFPSEISTVLHPERQTLNNEAGLENSLKIDVLLYSVVVCTAVEVD